MGSFLFTALLTRFLVARQERILTTWLILIQSLIPTLLVPSIVFWFFFLFLKVNVINIRSTIFKCLCYWNIQIKQISFYFSCSPEKFFLCNDLVCHNISSTLVLSFLIYIYLQYSTYNNKGCDSICSFFPSYKRLVRKNDREYSIWLPI